MLSKRFLMTSAPFFGLALAGMGLATAQSSSPFAVKKRAQAWEQQPAVSAAPQSWSVPSAQNAAPAQAPFQAPPRLASPQPAYTQPNFSQPALRPQLFPRRMMPLLRRVRAASRSCNPFLRRLRLRPLADVPRRNPWRALRLDPSIQRPLLRLLPVSRKRLI